jgi:hypothetical protein
LAWGPGANEQREATMNILILIVGVLGAVILIFGIISSMGERAEVKQIGRAHV